MAVAVSKTFEYTVMSPDGKRSKGKIEAATEAAAVQQLKQQGMAPLAVTEAGGVLRREVTIPGMGNRTTLKDLTVFTRQFATMTASGMSLLRSLSVLEEQAARASLKHAIGEVRLDIEAGLSLSAALAKHPKVFPTLMVAMIKAGETGGFLDEALERIATNMEKDASLRGKTKSALTYPVIVLGFTALLIAGMLTFIVPVFEKMFAQYGSELPLPTKVMVVLSDAMIWLGPLLIGVIGGGTMLVRRQLRTSPGFRLKFDAMKLRLPVFGSLFSKIAISRFSRNLGTLLSVGVPVMQALDVVGATAGNAVITDATKQVATSVRDGHPMSHSLGTHAVFPRMVAQMIEVGEESGQISQMLDKIADFYDREVESAADSLTASIEPIMVLLMGVGVGSMVVCLYLPMFTIFQNIQGAG